MTREQNREWEGFSARRVPRSWILLFATLLDEKGFSSQPILRRCGIDPALSGEDEEPVSLAQFASLVAEALRITGETGLGLEYGLRGQISHFGIFGYALLSAKDLRQATEFVSRYYKIFEPVVSLEFEISPPLVCARAVTSAALGEIEIFAHEATLACSVAVARILLDEPISLSRLTLCYSEPPHGWRYAEAFQCQPEFDSPYTSIQFESRHLNAPLKFSNKELAEICRQQCDRWLDVVKERDSLIFKVKKELLQAPGGFPRMNEVAVVLGMSVRSLRRHLSEEGVTYQELLDQVRGDLAVDYLRNSCFSVEQIAQLVGYGEAASFRKAFRKWTGKAPGEFRT